MNRYANSGKNLSSAFTIIELLIVIVIIGILVTITAVAYNNITQKAEFASLQSNTKNIETQIELYKSKNGTYPTSITSCPTPSPTEICVKTPEGVDMDYKYFPKGTRSLRSDGAWPHDVTSSEGLFELSLAGNKDFIYVGKGEVRRSNEFTQYMDLEPFISKYGLKEYELEVELKSLSVSNSDKIQIYSQNGNGARHDIGYNTVTVSESFGTKRVRFTPYRVAGNNDSNSILAFFGVYNTGNIPVVDYVRLYLAQ